MDTSKVKIDKFDIPREVSRVTETLKNAGFEAFLVGGCVRDLFASRKPKDWDITTNAKPDQITPLFPKTVYENDFGTVAVVNEDVDEDTLKIIEVTPYRIEGKYSDHRRPDEVKFAQSIQEDLKRRDFTINAIAYDSNTGEVVDPFGGVADLARQVIKTVGNPDDRFEEDGLRLLRAVRFHVELGFPIDPDTERSIIEKSDILSHISKERIRDELVKIIMSEHPMVGFQAMRKLGLLHYVMPELEKTVDIEQKGVHIYDVWTHLLKSLQHSADKGYPLHVRLSALLHDISKPETRRFDKASGQYTFYGHEVVGSRVTKKILENLKFSRETIEKVVKMVRWHMFFSDTETITPSAVRRLIVNVGKENVWGLMDVRVCDRIGTGRPKENPYRLRKYKSMIEEVIRDPLSVGMLKIDGNDIIKKLNVPPGPIVGYILNILLEEVLDNPTLNTKDYLEDKAMELSKLSLSNLKDISEKSKQKKEELENMEVGKIRGKYHVQ